jgi:enoyl-CoA hydratase/carnithine racemase
MGSPLSVQAVRAAAYEGLELSLDEGLELEQKYAEPLRQSTDVQEGLQAFIEKRDSDWKGK